MDSPFQGDNSPFLVPYPAPAPADPVVKPFTAVDLVPPLGQAGGRLQAPQASPFLEKESGKEPVKPSAARGPSGLAAALPDPLHPIPSGSLSQVFAPSSPSASGGFPFASQPAPIPKPSAPAAPIPMPKPMPVDFTPVAPPPFATQAAQPVPLTPFATPAAQAVPLTPFAAPAAASAPPAPAAVPAAPAAAPAKAAIPAPVPASAALPAGPVIAVTTAAAPAAIPAASGTAAALRASATPRRGAASEIIPKTDLAMTDADAPEPTPLIVTSGPAVDGRKVSSYLGVVSSEIVIPMDVLFRNPAPYGELHRIKVAEEQLQRVKAKACEELNARARALGADGILAVTLQYSQIDAVAFLCAATGTAVKLG